VILVKSIRALAVVRGKMPRKSHTSSANRGPRLPVPWQADFAQYPRVRVGSRPARGKNSRAGHRVPPVNCGGSSSRAPPPSGWPARWRPARARTCRGCR
jgi:hypothetical protein